MPSKTILFFAKIPMNYVVFKPVHERLKNDPRIKIIFSAKYQGSYFPQKLYRQVGLDNTENYLSYKFCNLKKYDLLINPDMEMKVGKRARIKIHTYHGASFKGAAISRKVLVYDQLFMIGPYQKRRYLEKEILQEGDSRINEIGFPKIDCLVDGSLNRKTVIDNLFLDPNRPTVLYAPSWRASSLYVAGLDIINTLAKMPLNVLVKLHDHSFDRGLTSQDELDAILNINQENVRIIRDFDINPYLQASDLLVSDASSVANEYTLLDRPMIYYDYPGMFDEYEKVVDMDTWGRQGGEVVRDMEELKRAVEFSLENPAAKSEIRKQIAADLFFNPGHAAEAAVKRIYELLELEPI